MHILGLSAFYHDSAAVLLVDGKIAAAAQEERFTRRKHDPGFPEKAVAYALRTAGLTINEIDHVVFYDKPLQKFDRLIETYLVTAPHGCKSFIEAMSSWAGDKLWLSNTIRRHLGWDGKILYTEHHEAHAASAFFPSPFQRAAVLTMDGVGEWATTTWGVGEDHRLDLREKIAYPHSLGLLYSAFTYYLGFKVNSGEYKVMGLAPYGQPVYADRIRERVVRIYGDGSYALNLEYFTFRESQTMTSERFHDLFGGPPRDPESRLTQREMDLAASLQVVLEEIVLNLVQRVHEQTGMENLCLAGGVALNCVANGRILRESAFKRLWIQPAAGDAGGALGAAYAIWHHYLQKPRVTDGRRDALQGSYLGPSFSDGEIARFLDTDAYPYQRYSEGLAAAVCTHLQRGAIVGWFQGRMEFGPRALGARSIIGDPRDSDMQRRMNVNIKFRESFRPFAPAVLREEASRWFDLESESPYMLLVAPVKKEWQIALTSEQQQLFGLDKLNVPKSKIPAVTHVDYSARIQTVDDENNPRYYQLLKEFQAQTGCPVLVNTSFNVRGEPIVCTPEEAYRCFMATDMDVLVLGDSLLIKSEQPHFADADYWRRAFPTD
jgi:carbamoyltransferase